MSWSQWLQNLPGHSPTTDSSTPQVTLNQPAEDSPLISFPTTLLYDQLADISDTCDLPDGRKLGFAHYGRQDGPQIFYLHGLPGSRVEGKCFFEKHLHKFGAGLIAVERPGLGLSSPHPGRTVSDHARDVLHLAKHLGLKEWRVLAVSGGCPYALACALHHPPDRLRGVAICAGIGPYTHGFQNMGASTKTMLLGFRFAPWLFHLLYRPIIAIQHMLSDERQLDMMQKNLTQPSKIMQVQEKDLEIFRDRDFVLAMIRNVREHYKQGFSGFLQDGQCIANDWDFRIEEIAFRPIQLWHGRLDVNCPLHMSEKTKEILGEGVELNVVDETHMSSR